MFKIICHLDQWETIYVSSGSNNKFRDSYPDLSLDGPDSFSSALLASSKNRNSERPNDMFLITEKNAATLQLLSYFKSVASKEMNAVVKFGLESTKNLDILIEHCENADRLLHLSKKPFEFGINLQKIRNASWWFAILFVVLLPLTLFSFNRLQNDNIEYKILDQKIGNTERLVNLSAAANSVLEKKIRSLAEKHDKLRSELHQKKNDEHSQLDARISETMKMIDSSVSMNSLLEEKIRDLSEKHNALSVDSGLVGLFPGTNSCPKGWEAVKKSPFPLQDRDISEFTGPNYDCYRMFIQEDLNTVYSCISSVIGTMARAPNIRICRKY